MNIDRLPAIAIAAVPLLLLSAVVSAGPPYVADDPQPTDLHHYEVYGFASTSANAVGRSGVSGIDFNYGAAADLQLTAVLPMAWEQPRGEPPLHGLGNIELAAKYRFLHQAEWGWDVALFPRVFLPAVSPRVGEPHAAVLLPLWLEKDWNDWSTFGGGGCSRHRGGDAQDFCLLAWALTRQVTPTLRLGAELQHQTADTHGGAAASSLGFGLQFDVRPDVQLLGYFAPSVQNRDETARYSAYAALRLIF
jgi:Putative MetA-pathway of phenol degradation